MLPNLYIFNINISATEAGRDDPEDDEPTELLTEDAGDSRGEA